MKLLLQQTKWIITQLLLHTAKSLITLLLFFLMLSMFIFNIQIQHFNSRGYITGTDTILQVDTLFDNTHAFFMEDNPFYTSKITK